MSEATKPEAALPELLALARALSSSLIGRCLNPDERAALACFRAACSVRAALPLGGEGRGVLLVSSDLRGPSSPSTYWATPSERSLVGRVLASGRTGAAEGPVVQQLADLSQLAAGGGGASFVCVPLLAEVPLPGAEPGPAVAALLLGYPSTEELPQEELRLALLLAAQVTRHHGRQLAAHVGRLHRALRPEEHAEWGPGVGPEYPELAYDHSPGSPYGGYEEEAPPSLLSSGGSSGAGGSGGGLSRSGSAGLPPQPPSAFLANAPGRVLPHTAARWAMSASTLRFGDERLEQRFQQWRNTRLAKVDGAALGTLVLYYLAACFMPPSGGCSLERLSACLPAALTVLVTLCLLLLSRSTRWYSQHRDQLLICTYVLLACHQALDVPSQLAAAAAVPEGLWRMLGSHVELLWAVALGIVLQVQFVGQCLMLAGGLVLKALMQPGCAGRLASPAALLPAVPPGSEGELCMLNGMARPLLLNVILPCGLAYYTELSARRCFCHAVMARRSSAGRR
ncbi:hypothetical protein ABPG75_007481 [Micractinium tetrahymenae]